MSNFWKVLKNLKEKTNQLSSKKIIEKTVIVAIVGVIILIAASEFFNTGTASASNSTLPLNTTQGAITASKQTNAEEIDVENRLSGILSKIQGAGRVEVMITYFSGSESIPGIDTKTNDNDTQEKDKEGGSRTIKSNERENKVIYEENGDVKKPFVVKELLPQVKGVVIVADGAGDIEVKSNLVNAATALLDIPVHKVQVFQRKNN